MEWKTEISSLSSLLLSHRIRIGQPDSQVCLYNHTALLFNQVGDYAMHMDFILNIFMGKYMQSLQWENTIRAQSQKSLTNKNKVKTYSTMWFFLT